MSLLKRLIQRFTSNKADWAKAVKTEAELLETLTADDNVGVVFSESADRETPKEILAIMDKITDTEKGFEVFAYYKNGELIYRLGVLSFDIPAQWKKAAVEHFQSENNLTTAESEKFSDWLQEELLFSLSLFEGVKGNKFSHITTSKINIKIADFAAGWHRDGNSIVSTKAYTGNQTMYIEEKYTYNEGGVNLYLQPGGKDHVLQGKGRSMHKGGSYNCADSNCASAAIHRAPVGDADTHNKRVINIAGLEDPRLPL